jgi:hypothetical protein
MRDEYLHVTYFGICALSPAKENPPDHK